MKWIGLYATFVHIQAKLGQENNLRMVREVRCYCPPYTGFEIRTLEVRGRERYIPLGHGGCPQYWVLQVDGEETFLFLSNHRDRERARKQPRIEFTWLWRSCKSNINQRNNIIFHPLEVVSRYRNPQRQVVENDRSNGITEGESLTSWMHGFHLGIPEETRAIIPINENGLLGLFVVHLPIST